MEGMKDFPDKYFDLAIVDPPYGIGITKQTLWRDGLKGKEWDNERPDKYYFNELFRVSKNQIIWGGNYFIEYLKNTKSFVVWDKINGTNDMADCELAWTSLDIPVRKYSLHHFSGNYDKHSKIHPTQKPIALYKWLLTKYAKPNDKILDTHVGSASSLIACEDMGFEYVGFELDKDYYDSAQKRLEQFRNQFKLELKD